MSLRIEWLNTLTSSTEYRVYRNGFLIATLPSGSTEYYDMSPPVGTLTYRIGGLVDGEEILGDEITIQEGSDWEPNDLTTSGSTVMRQWDVDVNASMLNNLAANPANGDTVVSIQPINSGSDGRLVTSGAIYREDSKFKWLETQGNIFTDTAQQMIPMCAGKHATLVSILMEPQTSNFADIYNIRSQTVVTRSYSKVETIDTSAAGRGNRYQSTTKADMTSSVQAGITSAQDQYTPNFVVVTAHIKWVDPFSTEGSSQVYFDDELRLTSGIADGDAAPVADPLGVSFRLLNNHEAKFYGMVVASRDDDVFHDGEVNSLIAYMKRKYYGRS